MKCRKVEAGASYEKSAQSLRDLLRLSRRDRTIPLQDLLGRLENYPKQKIRLSIAEHSVLNRMLAPFPDIFFSKTLGFRRFRIDFLHENSGARTTFSKL